MRDLNHIPNDAIALYIKGLEAKGYSKQEIAAKLRSIGRFTQWAYEKDHLQYSRYQHLKDEIAKYSLRYAPSADFPTQEDHSGAFSFDWASPIKGRAPPDQEHSTYPDGHIVDVSQDKQNTINLPHTIYGLKDTLINVIGRIPLLHSLPGIASKPVTAPLSHDERPILGPVSEWPRKEEEEDVEERDFNFRHPAFLVGTAMTLLIFGILTAGIYDRFFREAESTLAFPSTPTFPSTRILSFQGRLTDSLGNPITAATNMRFRLYTASTGGTQLYDSGTCSISPDTDGIHNVLIGSDCGSGIASSVFTENADVYLGVTVGTDSEMTPRQRIANVPYALNAETLQGLPPGTNTSNVAYINDGGDLLIAAASPQVGSTYESQTFLLSSANAITVQSAGTGDVTLTATGSGELVFATAGSTRAVVDNSGNVGIGDTTPTGRLQVAGDEVRIGNAGTPDSATGDGDLYVEDALEVDGSLDIDGTVDLSSSATWTGNVDIILDADAAAPVDIGADIFASGALLDITYDTAETLTGNTTGLSLNLNSNVTGDDDHDVTGVQIQTPALTGDATATTNLYGTNISAAGALDTSAAGATNLNWYGTHYQLPDIDTGHADDTTTVYGVFIEDSTITDGAGTENVYALFAEQGDLILQEDGNGASGGAGGDLILGAGGDLELYHDGTDSRIITNTGDLNITATDDFIFTDAQVTNIQLSDVDTTLPNSNTGIVDAINDAYNAATGGGGGLWSDSGTTTYLTATGDDLVLGGSSPLSSAKLSIDGDTDQIQFIVQGNSTQTSSLAVFEQSDGTDAFTVANNGDLVTIGDLAVNGDDITADGNLTINPAGGTTNVTGDADISSQLAVGPNASITSDQTITIDDRTVAVDTNGTYGIFHRNWLTGSGSSSATHYGIFSEARDGSTSTGNIANYGIYNNLTAANNSVGSNSTWRNFYGYLKDETSSGTINNLTNYYANSQNSSTGNWGSLYNYFADTINTSTGTITNNYNFYASSPSNSSGTITNSYGLYLEDQSVGTNTSAYGIYIADQDGGTNDYGIYGTEGDWILDADGGGAAGTDAGGDLILGEGQDFELYHDGTDSVILTNTGDLNFTSSNDGFNFTLGGGAGDDFIVDTDTLVVESDNDQVGIGTSSPGGKLEVEVGSTDAITGLLLDTNDTDQIAFDIEAAQIDADVLNITADSLTTANVIDVSADGLTTGNVLNLASTSTALTSGRLASLDWSPGSSTTATGDLFRLNIGANGDVDSILNITDAGSSLFKVAETGITNALPTSFTSPGDVSFAYDAIFTNQTSSQIESYGPFSIIAGESSESNPLTFTTYNSGNIVLDAGGATSGTGTVQFNDSNVQAATVTTPIDFADSSTDINTFRTNFTNENIIDAINDTYAAATGSSGGLWTDSGTNTYLTTTTDEVIIGGTSALSSAKLSLDGDADQIQFVVQGNSTQTSGLAVFEQSDGTDALTIANNGDVVTIGDLAVNGDDITADGNLTINPAGGTTNITGDADISSQLALGNNASVDSQRSLNIYETGLDVDNTSYGIYLNKDVTGTASNAAGDNHYGIYNFHKYQGAASAGTPNVYNSYDYLWLDADNSTWGSTNPNVTNDYNYLKLNRIEQTINTAKNVVAYSQASDASQTGTATIFNFESTIANSSTGTIANAYNFYANGPSNASGTITNAYGLYVEDMSVGTNTSAYGIYIADQDGGTNDYGIYGTEGDWILDADGGGAAGTDAGGDLILGEGQDFELYHDGTDSRIITNTGDLNLTATDDFVFTDAQVTNIQLSDVDTTLPNSNTGIVDAINDAYNAATGGGGGLWTDGGSYIYPTAGEVLGNSTSAGSNKIAGLYIADDSPLTLGTDNNFTLQYDETTSDALELGDGTNTFLGITDDGSVATFTLTGDVDISSQLALGAQGAITTGVLLDIDETVTDIGDVYGIRNEPTPSFTASGTTNLYGNYINLTDNVTFNSNTIRNYGEYIQVTIPNNYQDTGGGNSVSARGIDVNVTAQHTSGEVSGFYGIDTTLLNDGAGSIENIAAGYFTFINDGALANAGRGLRIHAHNRNGTDSGDTYRGVDSEVETDQDTATSTLYYGTIDNDTNTLTTANGYWFNVENSGTITTTRAIYIDEVFAGTQTNAYGIWADEGDWILDEDGDGASGGTSGGGDLILGEGQDLELYHDGTDSLIVNNTGDLNINLSNTNDINFGDGTNPLVAIKDQGDYPFLNLAAKSDTGDPATCAEGDIYYNDADDTISICHESNTWEQLDGGGGGGGTPGGSDTQLQYNNGGSFGGTSSITFDDSTLETTITDDLSLSFAGTENLDITTTSTTTDVFDITADSLTTANVLDLSIDGLTTGVGLNIASTSTALTSGRLASLDWSPGSSTIATGDLFRLNIGSNGDVDNLLNITDNGSTLFKVAETGVESTVPTSFTAAGDTSFAYDLLLTNQTSSYIKSNAPLYIQAGETHESNDFTLKTYNSGDVVFDAGGSTTNTGTISFYDSNIKGATVTTAIPFADSSADINTFRSNFTNENIIDAINETYSTASGGGGPWTDSGTNTYLTTTTDELILGGSSPLSSAKFSIDGDADQIQLIVQGHSTQTSSLAVFEQSDGTDAFTVANNGDLATTGDLAVNGDDITSDSNLTLAATGYVRVGDSGTPGSASGDDDLYVEGDLEVDGVLYLDGTLDTSFTAGSAIFAGASGVLAQDNSNFFWDDTNNTLGIGTNSPTGKLHVTGAVTGKALSIFNETGDQDIIAASASGTTRYRVANDGGVYGGYWVDISNNTYGLDPAGTTNFGGNSLRITGGALLAENSGSVGIGLSSVSGALQVAGDEVRIGDSGTPGNATADGDLYVEDALEVDGTFYADGGIDTAFTAGSVVFAGTDGVLSQDNSNFFWDDTGDELGIGTTAPESQLDIEHTSGGYLTFSRDDTTVSTDEVLGQIQFHTNDSTVTSNNAVSYIRSVADQGFSDSGGGRSRLEFGTSFGAAPSTYMSINRLGYVGIGSLSSGSAASSLGVGSSGTLVTDGTDQTAFGGINVNLSRNNGYALGMLNSHSGGNGLLIQASDGAGEYPLRIQDYNGTAELLALEGNGELGIGTSAPAGKLEVEVGSSDGATGFLLDTDDTDQIAMQITAAQIDADVLDIVGDALTTANIFDVSADALTTGNILNLASTSTALTSGSLATLDWSPGSSTTATGDLFSINIGANGDVDSLLNISDAGTSVFKVSETGITNAVPTSFTSAGDVSFAYDAIFTNQTSSQIESYGPFSIIAGEAAESNPLTLTTYNSGNIVLDAGGSTSGTGTVQFNDSNVQAATTTTPIDFADASSTINTFRTNFTNETVIGAINEAYAAAGIWTDGGSYIYPTSDEVLGDSTSGGSNKIAGLYLGDSEPIVIGADNDITYSFSGSALAVTTGSNDINFDSDTLFIDGSADRVGIGTTSPQATFHVRDAGATDDIAIVGGAIWPILNRDQNTGGLYVTSNGAIVGDDDLFYVQTSASSTLLTVKEAGNIGIGATSPGGKLEVEVGSADAVTGFLLDTDDTDQTAMQITADQIDGDVLDIVGDALTTANIFDVSADALTTGNILNLASTSTALTTGRLASLDWSPGSSTTATGDLFRINIGSNGDVDNLLNITDNGTSVFKVAETGVTTAVPASFTASGDTSFAYDLLLTNQTSSYIKSNAPLYIQAGETHESNDLTLQTYNSGDLVFDVGGDITANADFLPDTDDTYDLGSSTKRWQDVYIGPASIHIGSDGDDATIGYNTTSDQIEFSDGTNTLFSFEDEGDYGFFNVAGKSDTGDPASCDEGDIYYNDADDTLKVCHESNTWEALNGSLESTFDVYDAAGGQTLSSTVTVNLDTTRKTHSNYTLASDEITVNSTGLYEITYSGSSDNSNTNRSAVRWWIEKNTGGGFAEEVGSRCWTYNRWSGTDGYNTCGRTIVLSLSSTDDIRLRALAEDGNADRTLAGGSSITVKKIDEIGSDLAEIYYTDNAEIGAGDIVSIHPEIENGVVKSSGSYDRNVLGVIATKPGLILGGDVDSEYHQVLLALSGRVPVKVTGKDGAIRRGDILTASDIPGVAQKAFRPGKVLGYAIDDWNPEGADDIGEVMLFVHTQYYDPGYILTDAGSVDGIEVVRSDDPSSEVGGYDIQGVLADSVKDLGVYRDLIAAELKAGLVVAEDVVVETLDATLVETERLVADVAEVGSAVIDELIVDRFVAQEAELTDAEIENLNAEAAAIHELEAARLESEEITTDTLESATIEAGTIIADNVDAQNVRDLRDRLARVAAEQTDVIVDTETLDAEVAEIQEYITQLTNQETPEGVADTATYQDVGEDITLDPGTTESVLGENITSVNLETLTVTGTASMTSLTVADAFSAGEVFIKDNNIVSLNHELKLGALEQVNIMNGGVIITADGTITAKGEIIAQAGVRSNSLQALNEGDDIALRLDQTSEEFVDPLDPDAEPTTRISNSQLKIENNSGDQVASINAEGSASFTDLSLETYNEATSSAVVIAARDNYRQTGIYAPAIQTHAAASGNGILPGGQNDIILFNSDITANSVINITPTSSTQNNSLYVDKVEACEDIEDDLCKPYFRVALDEDINSDVKFNWLIVN